MAENKKAVVYVSLKDGVLDPQGVTIQKALSQMGYSEFVSVRSGKFFELEIESDASDLDRRIDDVSSSLLSNPVIEKFRVERS